MYLCRYIYVLRRVTYMYVHYIYVTTTYDGVSNLVANKSYYNTRVVIVCCNNNATQQLDS